MKAIPKFLQGGSWDMFMTQVAPPQVNPTVEAPRKLESSPKETKKEELDISKEILGLVKGLKGLPNEKNSFITNLRAMLDLNKLMGASEEDLIIQFAQLSSLAGSLELNLTRFDEATKKVLENGAAAEPVITPDGKLIVQNKNSGKLERVTLEKYFKEPEDLMPLSNSQYANLRARASFMNDNDESFDILNNSIGYESFLKLLDLKSIELGEQLYNRSGNFNYDKKALDGLKILQTLPKEEQKEILKEITSEGKYTYDISKLSNVDNIKSLINYLTRVLPSRAKNWASFKLQMPNREEATKLLISSYLLGGTQINDTVKTKFEEFEEDDTKSKTKKTSGSEEEPKMTYLTALQSGWGGRKETRIFNPGNQSNFRVTGNVYGSFADQDGKTISDNTLSDLLSKTGLSGISNLDSITFGDNIINVNSLSRIAIENNGGFRAILPCVKNGTKVTPNFDLITSFDELVQEVNDELGSSATYEDRLKALEEKIKKDENLVELLDNTGKLDKNKFLVFFIVNGLASDLNFEFKSNNGKDIEDETNPLIHETNNPEDINYFKQITTSEEFDEFDSMWENLEWLNEHNKVYEGNIFIPILTNNRLAAIIFSGQKVKDSTGMSIEHEHQIYTTQQDLKQPNSEYLFQ